MEHKKNDMVHLDAHHLHTGSKKIITNKYYQLAMQTKFKQTETEFRKYQLKENSRQGLF